MITVEFEGEESVITVMDDEGGLEDVQSILWDDMCFIRQWNDTKKEYDVITLTAPMYLKLMESWKLAEGTYIMETRK